MLVEVWVLFGVNGMEWSVERKWKNNTLYFEWKELIMNYQGDEEREAERSRRMKNERIEKKIRKYRKIVWKVLFFIN